MENSRLQRVSEICHDFDVTAVNGAYAVADAVEQNVGADLWQAVA